MQQRKKRFHARSTISEFQRLRSIIACLIHFPIAIIPKIFSLYIISSFTYFSDPYTMGLCKCAKKKVTSLFCFEHRVNVCEYCLVENHSKCVVQSYLSWLADSDYDTNCMLCSTPLEAKETVRLKCLHLFHWECLDAWACRLPRNIAPAGYKCQQCQESLFPSPNQTSPTIERLRAVLQQANWARAGLGLSLLPELDILPSSATFATSMISPSVNEHQSHINGPDVLHEANPNAEAIRNGISATVIDVDDEYNRHEHQRQFIARKSINLNENNYMSASALLPSKDRDEDLPENKYKRRSASEWLNRWFRSRYDRRSAFDPCTQWKRGIFYIIVCIIMVMTIFTVLSRLMNKPSSDDPVFNPFANPNIRIAFPERSQ
ncbi:Zinc finger protein-like [Dirofilaria immitis]